MSENGVKLHVILCGPLAQTERALLQRGDVEIHRDADNLNLLVQINNNIYDCDMIIVEAPYGHGLYNMTYPVREGEDCPVWMVADPPDEFVWKEIIWQLDSLPSKKAQAREKAVRMGPPQNKVLILADTPQRRNELTSWARDVLAGWDMAPELIAPEDVKVYLRELHELHEQEAPPELVVVAMPGVDSLNTAENIRQFYPKTGLVWSCDLNFAMQAYELQADYFFRLNDSSQETLEMGLNRWRRRVEIHKERGNIL